MARGALRCWNHQGQHVRNPQIVLRSVDAAGRRRYPPGNAVAAFDALATTRQLKARSFDSDQAEAITEVVRIGVTGGVAAKADIAEVKADIAELRTGLRWVKAIGAGIVGILIVDFVFVFNMLTEFSTGLAAPETAVAALASGG